MTERERELAQALDACLVKMKAEYDRQQPDADPDECWAEAEAARDLLEELGAAPLPPVDPIEILELNVRTYHLLQRAGIRTLGDLISKPAPDLARLHGLGPVSVVEVAEALARYGLALGTPPPPGVERVGPEPVSHVRGKGRLELAARLRQQGLTYREIGERIGVSRSRARELVLAGLR